jgi:hypothetical protein
MGAFVVLKKNSTTSPLPMSGLTSRKEKSAPNALGVAGCKSFVEVLLIFNWHVFVSAVAA